MLIALIILATIACHRIWHYEDIFAPVRSMLGSKLLLDPAITPLWISGVVTASSLLPHSELFLTAIAVYPFLRGAVWLYQKYDPPIEGKKCSPCEEKRNKMLQLQKDLRKFAKRVVVIGDYNYHVDKLRKDHKDWVFILHPKKSDTKRGLQNNLYYFEFMHETQPGTMNNLVTIIMHGGNATLLWINQEQTPLWKLAVERIGSMKALAWVHVGGVITMQLPAHHVSLVGDGPLDKVVSTASPPA